MSNRENTVTQMNLSIKKITYIYIYMLLSIYIISIFASGEQLSIKKALFLIYDVLPELLIVFGCFKFVAGLKISAYKPIKFTLSLIAFVYILIFFSQSFYKSMSGEWITKLAMENANQAYLLVSPFYLAIIALMVTGAGIYAFLLYRNATANNADCGDNKKRRVAYICLAALLIIQNTHFGSRLVDNESYLSPAGAFLKTSASLFRSGTKNAAGDDYPYIKNYINKSELPFEMRNSVEKPNVIVIFTEGTSARVLTPYNDKYRNSTPNINNMAQHPYSMIVDNYFNHTAATFRGTIGQLSSSYNYAGGYGKNSWTEDKDKLKDLRSSTLPKLLAESMDYNTFFLSPHSITDPYYNLLQKIEFSKIYCKEDIEACSSINPTYFNGQITDKDMYSFLREVITNDTDTGKPFFIAMYTFNTHAGIEAPSDENVINDNDNLVLKQLKYTDYSFGRFWDWFINSEYSQNTIVILTADHAHYNDSDYLKLVSEDSDYTRCFIDRIPLIIYDPVHVLPKRYDAEDNTSIDLTPTICQLVGAENQKNSFLGTSIFEKHPGDNQATIAAIGDSFFCIYDHQAHTEEKIDHKYLESFNKQRQDINTYYMYEKANRIFK